MSTPKADLTLTLSGGSLPRDQSQHALTDGITGDNKFILGTMVLGDGLLGLTVVGTWMSSDDVRKSVEGTVSKIVKQELGWSPTIRVDNSRPFEDYG